MPKIKTIVIMDVDNLADVHVPVEVDYHTVDEYGWIEGTIEVQNVCQYGSRSYRFNAKVYGLPSNNGIDGGCISKLYVKDVNTNTEVIGYDRGWYLEPTCPQEYAALNALLEIFDTPYRSEYFDRQCDTN